MSNKYTVELATGETMQYARKDAAVAAGEKVGGAFTVMSPSGAIVHTKGVEVAPKPAPKQAKKPVKTEGNPVVYLDTHGAKRFFPAMGAGAVALAEAMGLTATLETSTRTVLVQGSKADAKKFEKAVDAAWKAAWAGFKEWKSEHREVRAQQWLTNDGKRQMYLDESGYLQGAVRAMAVL